MKHICLFLFVLPVLLMGCIEEYTPDIKEQRTGILVIEGTISGQTEVVFYLSRTVALDSVATSSPERGAEVRILCDDGTASVRATETEAGKYVIPYGALDNHKMYCAEIKTGGKTYQSEFMFPVQTPPIDTLYWYKENRTAPVDIFLSTHDPSNQAKYYMWTFVEDWEFHAKYETTHYAVAIASQQLEYRKYEEQPNPYYYCWVQQPSTQIMVQSTDELSESKIVDYPIHTFACTDPRIQNLYCITVQQKALQEQTYLYYKNKQKLLEEMGTIFSPLPSELKGNIVCLENPDEPVVGFIDVSEITLKRLFIDNNLEGIYYDEEYDYCGLYTYEELTRGISPPPTRYDVYNQGYRYVILPEDTSAQNGLWAHRECVDCTVTGTKKKPDFWPNDHE